jgi:hypothetical protein
MEKQNDNEEDVDNKNKEGGVEAQKMYSHFLSSIQRPSSKLLWPSRGR